MTQEMQKQADNPVVAALRLLGQGARSPKVQQAARLGAGAGAGYYANNAYLNQVNPDVSDMGRTRSNVMSAFIGAGLGARGAIPAMLRRPSATLVGAGALGARYGVLMPDREHGHFAGLGDVFDPGKSKIQPWVSKLNQPATQKQIVDFVKTGPIENTADYLKDKGFNWLTWLLDYKGKKGDQPSYQEKLTSGVKDTVLPATYSSIIKSLGSTPSDNPTFSDVGMALAPHLTGGASGGYLGYLLSRAAGNYMFRDNPRDSYEERRRQENRRYWLNFLGGNLGVLGGVLATAKAMPQLNQAIGKYVTQGAEKKGSVYYKEAEPWFVKALKGLKKDVAVGAGLTAGQYASGLVPSAEFDSEGVGYGQNARIAPGLLVFNALLANKGRKTLGNPNYYTKPHRAGGLIDWIPSPVRNRLPLGAPGRSYKAPLTDALTLGTGVAAGPSILNTLQPAGSLLPQFGKQTTSFLTGGSSDKLLPDVPQSLKSPLHLVYDQYNDAMLDPDSAAARDIGNPSAAIRNAWGGKDGLKEKLQKEVGKRVSKTLTEAAVPGFDKKQLGQFLTAGVLSSIAQGSGIVGGGFAGMLGTNWVMDKLLSMATKKKWLKNRPRVHAFIRDLASLIGAGAGAYGTMRLMNYAIPALANRNAAKGTDTAKPEATEAASPAAAAGAAAAAAAKSQAPAPAAEAPKTESK